MICQWNELLQGSEISRCQGQISPCQGGFHFVFCTGFVAAEDTWSFLLRMMGMTTMRLENLVV